MVAGALAALVWFGTIAGLIVYRAQLRPTNAKADAAIVLGAAASAGIPSPVLAARIDHAVSLYRAGSVKVLIFTGGAGVGETVAESEAARRYALDQGVPAENILTDQRSRTTWQNLLEAKHLMVEHHLTDCLLVSDPLHMLRATQMMRDLGLTGTADPTPTSRIQGLGEQTRFLLREVYLFNRSMLVGD